MRNDGYEPTRVCNRSTWVGECMGRGHWNSSVCGYLYTWGVCKKEHKNKQSQINMESFKKATKYSQSKVDHCPPPEQRAS